VVVVAGALDGELKAWTNSGSRGAWRRAPSVRIAMMFQSVMRFDARHVGSCVWGIWDGGVMSWHATDLAEDEAHQQAADLNVIYNQYGQREQKDRREVKPPIEVNSATSSAAGQLDYWVKERQEWWGRVRGSDGHQMWIKAADLRPLNKDGYH
jgi:hypothetical protein